MFARFITIIAFLVVASTAQAQTIIWSAAGTTCVPTGATVGHYQSGATAATVRHLGTETGTLVFTCGMERFTSAITDWVLKLSYRDSTGMDASASVVAKLYRMPLNGFTPVLIDSVSSNVSATMTNNIVGNTSFAHTFNFNTNLYFVQVTLTRGASGEIVQFHSVAIEEK